jgi:hypothetical protein
MFQVTASRQDIDVASIPHGGLIDFANPCDDRIAAHNRVRNSCLLQGFR